MCENRQYLTQIQMEIFLVYFIRLIFTLNGWKLLRFVNVFVCLFSFRVWLIIAPVTWVFPDSCRFRGHDMTNKEYALRRGVQWTFSIHSAYLLKNQSQNKKLSGSVWRILIIWESSVRALFLYNCTPNTSRVWA